MSLTPSRKMLARSIKGLGFRDAFEAYVRLILKGYGFKERTIKDFLNNTFLVGFGVEQLHRGILPNNQHFMSYSREFTKRFVDEYKELMSKDKNLECYGQDAYFFCSKERQNNKIYFYLFKKDYVSIKSFFDYNDLEEANTWDFDKNQNRDYMSCAYSHRDDCLYIKNEKQFKYRIRNFNKDSNDEWFWDREIWCENIGKRWAEC